MIQGTVMDEKILTFVFCGPENEQKRGQIGEILGYARNKLILHSRFSIFLQIVMLSGFAYLGHHKAAFQFLVAIKMAPKWTGFPIFLKNSHIFP